MGRKAGKGQISDKWVRNNGTPAASEKHHCCTLNPLFWSTSITHLKVGMFGLGKVGLGW